MIGDLQVGGNNEETNAKYFFFFPRSRYMQTFLKAEILTILEHVG